MRPKERLLRSGKIPNDQSAIRSALESWADRLSHWTVAYTAIVVLGLAIEYLPEITYFLKACVAETVRPHSEQLRQFGGLLVIVGVAGELLVAVRAARVETDLREESNSAVARAHERAATAEKIAAEANLARFKIESQLFKPHVLTEEATIALREILNAYSGTKRVDVFMFDSHMTDVSALANSINAVFSSAGWKSNLWIGTEPRMTGAEAVFSVPRELPLHDPENQALQQLSNRCGAILWGLEIGSCISVGGFSSSNTAPRPSGGWGLWNPNDVAMFRIQIGQRQLTSGLFARPVRPPQA